MNPPPLRSTPRRYGQGDLQHMNHHSHSDKHTDFNDLLGDDEDEKTRTLTNADVEFILNKMEKRFYINFGKSIWSIVWKAIALAVIAFVSYGAGKHG